jgi:hypothetical protein
MRRLVMVAVMAALMTILVAPAEAADRRPDFRVPLSGANEVGGGDPDGTGVARVDFTGDQVCFDIQLSGVDDVILAHIHAAPAGVNGPVVIDFMFLENGLDGCVTADRNLMRAIRRNPAGYYVNVHSVEFPGGAVRGQLG